jgi:hypothetical protein
MFAIHKPYTSPYIYGSIQHMCHTLELDKMRKITLRIDEQIDDRIKQFSSDNGINNVQEAYRRILISGLKNETMFDKNKVITFEREVLKELKLLRGLTISNLDLDKNEIQEKENYLRQEIAKMKILGEL